MTGAVVWATERRGGKARKNEDRAARCSLIPALRAVFQAPPDA